LRTLAKQARTAGKCTRMAEREITAWSRNKLARAIVVSGLN
jgi:hypothetical protein